MTSSDRPWAAVPVDERVSYFVGLTHENLAAVAAGWPRSASTPASVEHHLDRACVQFALGAVIYDEMTEAVSTAMVACEVALKDRLGSVAPRARGLGVLIEAATSAGIIAADEVEWWDQFIRPQRNKFAHGDPVLFTPGMAAGALDSLFASVAALYPEPDGPGVDQPESSTDDPA
jgi:hypothetical protein